MTRRLSIPTFTHGAAATVVGSLLLTALLAPIGDDIGLLNVGLMFLLLTLGVSAIWGWRLGFLAACLTNLSLNFFFIEPLHTFGVERTSDVVSLVVFLGASLAGGSLLYRARAEAEESQRREAETAALLAINRVMIGQTEPHEGLRALCRLIVDMLACPGACVLAGPAHLLAVVAHAGDGEAGRQPDAEQRALAQLSIATGAVVKAGNVGLGAPQRVRIVPPSRLSRAPRSQRPGLAFAPLRVGERAIGVLRIDGPAGNTVFSRSPERMLEAFAGEAALALHRTELASAASQAEALRRADDLKTALMTSISHDLKTPLAGIKTAVTSLLDEDVSWTRDDRTDFLRTIDSQADRLDGVISDILDLNRIESGAVVPLRTTVDVAELVQDARTRTRLVTKGRAVKAIVSPGLTMLTDDALVSHALVNLVENAARYSAPRREIRVIAQEHGDAIEIAVEDEGPGISAEDLPHVFERFYRGRASRGQAAGSGLGLAITEAFVRLCGGSVRAENTATGTRFVMNLPGSR